MDKYQTRDLKKVFNPFLTSDFNGGEWAKFFHKSILNPIAPKNLTIITKENNISTKSYLYKREQKVMPLIYWYVRHVKKVSYITSTTVYRTTTLLILHRQCVVAGVHVLFWER